MAGLSLSSALSLSLSPRAGGGAGSGSSQTPDGALESVIVPDNTTPRAMYAFTKVGTINDFGNGPADPLYGNGAYSNCVIRATCEAYPDRHFMYYSPDHGEEDSGIWAKVCVADPTVIANWRTIADAAVNTDWLADISGAPTSEGPIFIGSQTVGDNRQCETPYVVQIGSTFMMTYQMYPTSLAQGGGDYSGAQATHRATSANGLTGWTTSNTVWLEAPTTALGDGHTGYAQPFKNDLGGGEYLFDGANLINSATGNPWTWLVTSLGSGGNASLGAIWGVEDPLTEYPTLIKLTNKYGGRLAPSGVGVLGNLWTFALSELSVASMRKTRQGVVAVGTAKPRGAGAVQPDTAVYEILLNDNMQPVDCVPLSSIPRGSSGADDEKNVSNPRIRTFGSKDYVVYDGVSVLDVKRQLLASTSVRRHPDNTWLAEPSVAIPSGLTDDTVDFAGAGSMPASVDVVSSGTVSTAFDATGLAITLTGAAEYAMFIDNPVDPVLADYMEIIVEGLQSSVASPARNVWIGWATAKALSAAQTDMLALTTVPAQEWVYKSVLVGGSEVIAKSKSEYLRGFGWTSEAQWPKEIGARIWPKLSTGVVIGENRAETEYLDNGSVGDANNFVAQMPKSAALYPCVIIQGLTGTNRVERIGKISVRWKASNITLPTFTLSSTSANTGEAWNAVIANHVPGTTYAATASDGTTITVTGTTLSGTFASAGTPTVTITPTRTGATNTGVAQSPITITVTAATTPIDPATLIATYGGVMFDPSDGSTVFADSAMTTGATADGNVGAILDKVGGSIALVQATSGRLPVYKVSGGKSWLQLDGTDDNLRGLFTKNRPFTRIGAFRANSWTNNDRIYGGAAGSADELRQSGTTPGIIATVGGATTIGTITPTVGVDCIVSEVRVTSATANSSKLRLNAGTWATNNSTNATAAGGTTLGAASAGTSAWGHFDSYGFCEIFTNLLTDAEIQGVEAWYAAKCRDAIAI